MGVFSIDFFEKRGKRAKTQLSFCPQKANGGFLN
jgi:hypothetical protein